MNNHFCLSGPDVIRVWLEDCPGTVQRHGDDGHTRENREVKTSGLEWAYLAVAAAVTFSENDYGGALANLGCGLIETLHRFVRSVPIYRDVPGPSQVPAQERQFEQRPFGQKAEPDWKVCE